MPAAPYRSGRDRAALRSRPAADTRPRTVAAPSAISLVGTEWRRFRLQTPPAAAGIYAIRTGARWLYIGSSQNIARRLRNPRHPARIALGLDLPLWFQWHPHPHPGLRALEARLIRHHAPEWNGGAEWGHHADGPTCALPLHQQPDAGAHEAQAEAARSLLLQPSGR